MCERGQQAIKGRNEPRSLGWQCVSHCVGAMIEDDRVDVASSRNAQPIQLKIVEAVSTSAL